MESYKEQIFMMNVMFPTSSSDILKMLKHIVLAFRGHVKTCFVLHLTSFVGKELQVF